MIYHFLRSFHISHDIFDVIWCAVFSMPIVTYPQIGLCIGIEAIVIFFDIFDKCSSLSVSQFCGEIEILSGRSVLRELENDMSLFLFISINTPPFGFCNSYDSGYVGVVRTVTYGCLIMLFIHIYLICSLLHTRTSPTI